MIEKYARMDNLIPPLSTNPLIDAIAQAEVAWKKTLQDKYPLSFAQGNADFFVKYLRSELETLSDNTLELYWQEIKEAQKNGINLVEQQHLFLCKHLGHPSLEAREIALAQKRIKCGN